MNKKGIQDIYNNITTNKPHGTAIARININENIKVGDEFVITAYLPEHDKFAILSQGHIVTFSNSEKQFLKIFDVRK